MFTFCAFVFSMIFCISLEVKSGSAISIIDANKKNAVIEGRMADCSYDGETYPNEPEYLERSCHKVVCETVDVGGHPLGLFKLVSNTTNPSCQLCKVWNDPHWNTSDGVRYNYHKKCIHVLAQKTALPVPPNHLTLSDTHFGIHSNFHICPGTSRTCLQYTTIKFNPNVTVKFHHNLALDYQIVAYNSKSASLPVVGSIADLSEYSKYVSGSSPVPGHGQDVLLFKVGRPTNNPKVYCIGIVAPLLYILICPNGIYIYYKAYQGTLWGMCGNFDKDPSNDLTTRADQIETDPIVFGKTWKVDGQACQLISRTDDKLDESNIVYNNKNCQNYETHLKTCSETVNEHGHKLDSTHRASLSDACVQDFCSTVRQSRSDDELSRGLEMWKQTAKENAIICNADAS